MSGVSRRPGTSHFPRRGRPSMVHFRLSVLRPRRLVLPPLQRYWHAWRAQPLQRKLSSEVADRGER